MSFEPRDFLRATRPGDAQPTGGRVKVLAALNRGELDGPSRKRLEALGMSIDAVISNKIVGSLPAGNLQALRADPIIAEVQTSVPLHPHDTQ